MISSGKRSKAEGTFSAGSSIVGSSIAGFSIVGSSVVVDDFSNDSCLVILWSVASCSVISALSELSGLSVVFVVFVISSSSAFVSTDPIGDFSISFISGAGEDDERDGVGVAVISNQSSKFQV